MKLPWGPDSGRPTLVFLALLAGGLGAIYWAAGGYIAEPLPASATDPGTDATDPDADPHRVRDAGVGSGRGGHYAVIEPRDIEGRKVLYTKWEARWSVAHPRESDDPENPDIHAEGVSLRICPPPKAGQPTTTTGAGPGVLEIDAGTAHIQKGTSTEPMSAVLENDVVCRRYDATPPEDGGELRAVTLETELLTIVRLDDEHQGLSSTERVVLRQPGAWIEGTGLEGNTREGFLELLADVRGQFETQQSTIKLTCDGRGRIELRDPRENVPADRRRWRRFLFADHPRFEDGKNVITCTDRLWVDMPVDPDTADGDRGPLANISAFEALGDFTLVGESAQGPYRIRADRARHHQEQVERAGKLETRDVLVLDGNPEMEFTGAIGQDRGDADRLRPSRTVIRSKGPATLTVRPHPESKVAGMRRFKLVFSEDVVMRQLDVETGEQRALLEAPTVSLYGNQLADRTLRPEHLTAEGGAHVMHGAFDARSRVVTWMEDQRTGVRRVILGGRPQVTFTGTSDLNPLGAGGRGEEGTLILTATNEISLEMAPEPPEGTDPSTTAGLGVKASGDVYVRKIVGETEPYYLRADGLKAVFDRERRLREATAYGNARLVGRAEDDSGRRGEANGERIVVRSPDGARLAEDVRSALILGTQDVLATALVHDEAGRVHRLRARSIEYRDGGAVIVASERAEAAIGLSAKLAERLARGDVLGRGDALLLHAREIRAELRRDGGPSGESKPQLLRLQATDRVLLETTKEQITGDRLLYDAVQGVAEAHGRPARVAVEENTASRRERGRPALISQVVSEHIRAVLTTNSDTGRPSLVRASCSSGRLQRYRLPDGDDGKGVVNRIRVESAGPITVDRQRASARKDVAVMYESELPSGSWKQTAKVLCEELDMTFDAQAEGELQERIGSMVAVGSADQRIRLITPRIEATADRMETPETGLLIHLTADPGRFVEVRDKTEGYRWRCDPGCSIHAKTYEWRAHGRSELLAD